MATTRTSSQFWLNARDFLKAFAVAALSAPITTILTSIQAGSFTIDWTAIWHMAAGSAAAYLLKNFLTPAQTVSTPPKIILFILCIGMATAGQAQSVFKPLPKQKHATSGSFMRSLAPAADSTFQGFRVGGPVVLLALPDLTVFTGVGIVYEHDTYRSGSSRYYKDWAVGISAVEGGQFAPNSLKAVTGLAAHVSFFDGFLTIGAIYNLTTQKAQGAIGPMTSLFPAN